MSQHRIDILERALKREKEARKAAERILEQKSTEIYYSNKKLEKLYEDIESELTRKDSQLQGVFENIVDAYVVMDLNGNILKMNNAALFMLGFENDKIDYNLMKMINRNDYQIVKKSYEQLFNKGKLTDFEININTYNNKKKLVHINASIIYDNNLPVAAQGIIRDVTKLREDEYISEVINDITLSILGKTDIYDISVILANKISIYLDTDDCVIYKVNHSDNKVEQITAVGEKIDSNGEIINRLTFDIGNGIVGSVAKTCKSVLISDTSKDNRYIKDLVNNYSEITVPILIDNKVIAIIDSEHPQKNHFTKTHLKTLESISNIIALKVKNAIILKQSEIDKNNLFNSEQRLRTLISSFGSGILLEDEKRRIVLTNSKFCEMFEIPLEPYVMIGFDCTNSADDSKHLVKNPQEFVDRINTILLDKKTVLNEQIEMANGQILERDYIPLFNQNNYSGHLWSYKDVTLLRKFRQTIAAQQEKYSNIIANMNLGLIEVNNNDEILMCNSSFCDMSGYTKKELIGKIASNLFLDSNQIEIIKSENLKRKKGDSNSYELKAKNKFGDLRYWLVSGAPNYNLNGKLIGSIGIHLDITDFKILQEQKERLLSDLEKRNEELQEYAHVVSHDLKSPLRNINALVSWLKEDNIAKLDEISIKNFNLVESTLEKMEQLITNVLAYSSLSQDSNLDDLINLNEVFLDLKHIMFLPEHISININPKLPVVQGDKTKLEQVFQNLISNAIKFCDKEKGFIDIDFKELDDFFQFSVKDNGMGIEEKYHEKIFKIFNYLNKSQDSSGIGLSIVKKIVDLHGGKIWLESTSGKGSTFYFTIKK